MGEDRIFKAFFEHLSTPVLLIDRQYKVVDANRALLRTLKARKDRILGAKCYELIESSNSPCDPCPAVEAIKTGKPITFIRRKDSSYLEIKGLKVTNTLGAELITDISESISLSKELKERADSLTMLERTMQMWQEAQGPQEILSELCRHITESLGYKMVWVGLSGKDSKIHPVVSFGLDSDALALYSDSPLYKEVLERLANSTRPLIMQDILNDPTLSAWKQEALRFGYRSALYFPLISKKTLVGTLNIYSEEAMAFDKKDLDTIKRLSFYATAAIENTMFIEAIRNSQREWESTFDAIKEPIFIHDKRFRLHRVNKAYQELSGASFREILGRPYYEVFPRRQEPLPSCLREKEDSSTSEEIISFEGRHFISDSFVMRAKSSDYFVHVLKDITGLISAQQKIKEHAQTMQCLLEFATQIGRLLDVDTILTETSGAIKKILSVDRIGILLKGDGRVFHIPEIRSTEHNNHIVPSMKLRLEDSPILERILKGQSILIESASDSPLIGKELASAFGDISLAISPLSAGEGVIGAIIAGRKKGFSDSEIWILRGIASSTAISLENARLYKESVDMAADLARKIETIKTTYEIDKAMLSVLDKDEIIEVASKYSQRVVPADKVITIVRDEKGGYLYRSRALCLREGASALLDSVVKTGRVISIPDISSYTHSDILVEDLLKEGFSSVIALPLFTKGRKLGCLLMLSTRVAAFDKEDISNAEKLAAQVAIALETANLYDEIKELLISTVTALVNIIDAKSRWTRGHSERVTEYALKIGTELGLSTEDMERLRLAGLLHDIGKVGTCDDVLDKPGKLTEEEFALVKIHPKRAEEMLAPIKQFKDIIPIIKGHHERIDGKGYPDGLKGEEIPLLARILCVADSFDSMTADRPYRLAPGRKFAIKELQRCSGTQFDPQVVSAFLRVLEREPYKS